MLQVNEETGNRRPIMLSIPTKEEEEKAASEKASSKDKDSKKNTEETNKTGMAPLRFSMLGYLSSKCLMYVNVHGRIRKIILVSLIIFVSRGK